jgi:hypothetical protein
VTDLESLAGRLVWWQAAAATLLDLESLLARVMVYGTPEDLAVARRHFPSSAFGAVLAQPPPGLFDPRSWAYWHVVLGLEPPGDPPARTLPG